MSASGSSKKVVAGRKNYPDNRSDIGWKHGTDVDGNSKKVKCNYCSKVFCGGIFRFKHHLAGTRENVEACLNVSDEVREKILEVIINAKENAEKKKTLRIDVGDDEANIGNAQSEVGVINVFNKPKGSGAGSRIGSTQTQSTINHMFKKDLREETCKQIACFFYTSAIPFNCIKNPEFTKMLELVGKFGQGLKPPSYHEIREKYLNMEVNEIEEMLKEYKEEWKRVGCSIMSDGWTDRKRRSICNFLVNSPKDLMLEDFEKHIPLNKTTISSGRKITTFIYARTMLISILRNFTKGRDLIRPATTRFATSYLTLACLNENKGALMNMFSSKEWTESKFSSICDGKQVENVVLDNGFWKNIVTCLQAAAPLIKVLRLVDSDEKAAMGFIYEAMNCARERIKQNFNNVKKSYEPIWNIIDERWEAQLHRPLHAAAYYVNPHFRYSPSFQNDYFVKDGLFKCLDRFILDEDTRSTIDRQMVDFSEARGMFGLNSAKANREKMSPADWWLAYGDGCPELQKFAIRILSLTCSSSGDAEKILENHGDGVNPEQNKGVHQSQRVINNSNNQLQSKASRPMTPHQPKMTQAQVNENAIVVAPKPQATIAKNPRPSIMQWTPNMRSDPTASFTNPIYANHKAQHKMKEVVVAVDSKEDAAKYSNGPRYNGPHVLSDPPDLGPNSDFMDEGEQDVIVAEDVAMHLDMGSKAITS
ncbi:SCAN domain-containing protein [Senna tora]|uniref:SCAN domain-containing protein n=1 Tax=Senna tora TaxID=362788 RepID=A0A834TRA9_9FABA|nr:SCAN domain-containing protein [Senna tora]